MSKELHTVKADDFEFCLKVDVLRRKFSLLCRTLGLQFCNCCALHSLYVQGIYVVCCPVLIHMVAESGDTSGGHFHFVHIYKRWLCGLGTVQIYFRFF
jgi:hypothetical protein